jgi:hypothetical protein
MKKIAIPVLLLSLLVAGSAFADGKSTTTPQQGSEVVPLGPAYEGLCREAIRLQEKRITDLRAAIEYDKKVERELLEGARIREEDARIKEDHARQWRQHANNVQGERRNAFNTFANWLEAEARTDREFARERRNAAGIIARGWARAAEAIRGHERHLAELRQHCAG